MLEKLGKTFEYKRLTEAEQKQRGILGRLVGPCADFVQATRNGRKYSEELWENVFSNDLMKEKIKNRCCFGELGHPTDRTETDMSKIALCLAELPKKGRDGKLYGVFDILDTPNGRILKALCDYGCNIGISSRGQGDIITDLDGNEAVDPDTYDCECFDAVLMPGVEAARLKYVTESLNKENSKGLKLALTESLKKANDNDRKIMEETLKDLNITLDENVSDKKEEIKEEVENKIYSVYFNGEFIGHYAARDEADASMQAQKDDPEAYAAIDSDHWVDYEEIIPAEEDTVNPLEEKLEIKDKKDLKDTETLEEDKKEKSETKNVFDIDKALPEDDEASEDAENVADAEETDETSEEVEDEKEEKEDEVESESEESIVEEPLEEKEVKELTEEEKQEIVIQWLTDNFDEEQIEDVLDILNMEFVEDDDEEESAEEEKDEAEDEEDSNEAEEAEENIENSEEEDSEQKEETGENKAVDEGLDSIVNSLQEALSKNSELENTVRILQEKLAVSDAKVNEVNEECNRLKNSMSRMSDLVKTRATLKENVSNLEKSLNEKEALINEQKVKIAKLVESKKENVRTSNELNESLTTLKTSYEKQIQTLNEQISSSKTESEKQISTLTENLNKANSLKESYKKLANKTVNKYIEVKANIIGQTPTDIKRKLGESYTLEDVDQVCEDLKAYSLNVSKLPFEVTKRVGVRVTESTNTRMMNNTTKKSSIYDDDVSDTLIKLANSEF